MNTGISVIQTVLWKNHLESNPYLYNANNHGITMTEGNMPTNVTLQTPTTNSTLQTIMSQSMQDAKRVFIATQDVKVSSIFWCRIQPIHSHPVVREK
ncbi:unnamed protein product [Clavelina lepadiformis]|uniref:Uncharacterized protein n=1 Tax=Clavelina lepadiformis TaxID=159417 RepID=A0ABP0G2A0_CLALP